MIEFQKQIVASGIETEEVAGGEGRCWNKEEAGQ